MLVYAKLISLLEKESEVVLKRFEENSMFVNSETFLATIINRQNKPKNNSIMKIHNIEIKSIIINRSILDVAAVVDPPLLLGNEINEKLNFENTRINYLEKNEQAIKSR